MSTNYPDNLMIKAYLEGKLDHEEMHRLEKQALTDPFLWEALEGYAYTSNPGTELSILQRQLHERIVHLQENKKVFDLTWQRLSVAASASVLFITAGILFWMNVNRSAPVAERQVQVALIDPDSLKTEINGSSSSAVIREKIYPDSSGETKIAAYQSPSGAKDDSEPDNSPATERDLNAAVTSIESKQARIQEQGLASRALSSSEGINASEQAVQPVSGWDIYRKYLEDNLRKPSNKPDISGSVLISFELDAKGRPVMLQILKGLTADCNEEAIRLIKDGPSWKTRPGSKINTGRIEVRF